MRDRFAGLFPHVFFSYATADGPVADTLFHSLRSGLLDGRLSLWRDANIPAGHAWEAELEHRIDTAEAVVVCASGAWSRSEWCGRELSRALQRGVPIIPILLEPVPGSSSERLRSLQWIPRPPVELAKLDQPELERAVPQIVSQAVDALVERGFADRFASDFGRSPESRLGAPPTPPGLPLLLPSTLHCDLNTGPDGTGSLGIDVLATQEAADHVDRVRAEEHLKAEIMDLAFVSEDRVWVNLDPGSSTQALPATLVGTRTGLDLVVADVRLRESIRSWLYGVAEGAGEFWRHIEARAEQLECDPVVSIRAVLVPSEAKITVGDTEYATPGADRSPQSAPRFAITIDRADFRIDFDVHRWAAPEGSPEHELSQAATQMLKSHHAEILHSFLAHEEGLAAVRVFRSAILGGGLRDRLRDIGGGSDRLLHRAAVTATRQPQTRELRELQDSMIDWYRSTYGRDAPVP